jgi:TonB-linked SusC/RagA family outer membrane protein
MKKPVPIPKKLWKVMKITFAQLLLLAFFGSLSMAHSTHAQEVLNRPISIRGEKMELKEILNQIEKEAQVKFVYSTKIQSGQRVSLNVTNRKLSAVLEEVLKPIDINYEVIENRILLRKSKSETNEPTGLIPREVTLPVDRQVTGRVTDENNVALPGVSVVLKGTQRGTTTNTDGRFELDVPETGLPVLVFSFVGYVSQEVVVGSQIEITLRTDTKSLEEVVVVGYGTQRRKDLTGSVVRADIESFRESPNVSILQSLQGTVAGLNIGQVNRAGAEPGIEIRGRTSLSGELKPLIVMDGVIYRGDLNNINPNDIESVDILKDASAAAVYGSQASNGVILLTTKKGSQTGKPVISYSNSFTIQSPVKEFKTGTEQDYLYKTELSDLFNSRTSQSGYLDKAPNWEPSTKFKTSDEILAYNQDRSTNWYSLVLNEQPSIQNHNIALSNSSEWNNFYVSMGYTGQTGYLKNEGYERINGRVNLDSKVTSWLNLGIQSTVTKSKYLGETPSPRFRYLSPYATPYDENGELIQIPGGGSVNPLIQMEADYADNRLNLLGNFFAEVIVPFIPGLSYKGNYLINYSSLNNYSFRGYASNFQGQGLKNEQFDNNWSSDHIITYKRAFKNTHSLNATLLYGVEERSSRFTEASSSIFVNPVLGYNSLQSGSADQQRANSGAWREASLYQMARVNYGYNQKYLVTATVRRDGFSGFGESNKFGLFPSLSLAWVLSSEPFFIDHINGLDNLKVRMSYGANGNRTIGRYQTLARVAGGFNYITGDRTPVYTQAINTLASPNLKWETTTGFNVGVDFSMRSKKLSGTVDYYNSETTNLLYQVNIPGIGRFETFPDNLGKIHNQGLEVGLTSVNLVKKGFEWGSSFVFSLNRNKLRELLGFDLNGDGKEDDLVSEGLFIGQPLDAIFNYQTNGLWQVGDEIPAYSSLGAYKVVDTNKDGTITPADRAVFGYREPSYRFSVGNNISYKNWTLRVFVNSVQGGKKRYLAEDNINSWGITNQENHFNYDFPTGLDFWSPGNPNASYERPNINVSSGIAGTQFTARSFTRLQDISIAYTVPSVRLKKLQLRNLKVFLSGKNLVTLTKWPGWDPETGENINISGLPVLKGYSMGINLSF